jgi:hypothetical protein
MRLLICGLALVVAARLAHADDVRTVPEPGIKLTYRLESTSKTPTKTLSTGQVYTYIVTKSDGATAEGIIKPNAIIIPCNGRDDLGCKDAEASQGAHLDGNLLTVPVDSDSGDTLAKHSAFKLNHFLVLSRVYPIPSSRNPKDYDLHDFRARAGLHPDQYPAMRRPGETRRLSALRQIAAGHLDMRDRLRAVGFARRQAAAAVDA